MVAPSSVGVGSAVSVLSAVAPISAGVACVVGKGPTADRYVRRTKPSVVLAINQAVGFVGGAVNFAVVTDFDVLTDDFFAALPDGCDLVLPFYPHKDFRPHRRLSVTSLLQAPTALRALAEDDRLLCYRSDRWPVDWPGPTGPGWPRLRVRAFTAVACVALLAAAGFSRIETAGVDGGTLYHGQFAAQGLTPLGNGRSSFDAQFKEFDRYRRRGVRIEPL